MWLFDMIIRDPADLTGQVAKRHRDRLVTVPGGVLVDQRGPRTGVAEPGHQFLKTRASGGGEGPACVPKIVEVHTTCGSVVSPRNAV
jgi:hypothetical protein